MGQEQLQVCECINVEYTVPIMSENTQYTSQYALVHTHTHLKAGSDGKLSQILGKYRFNKSTHRNNVAFSRSPVCGRNMHTIKSLQRSAAKTSKHYFMQTAFI